LALVQELVKLHGSTIEAHSVLGEGTTFRVLVPFGATHLPADRVLAPRALSSTAIGARTYVHEALRWLQNSGDNAPSAFPTIAESTVPGRDRRFAATFGSRIVLADDNADVRGYVRDLFVNQPVQQSIIEWQPPRNELNLLSTGFWFFAILLLLAVLMAAGPRRPSAIDLLWYAGMGWLAIGTTLVLAFVFSHYLFASTTAHISAMMLAFLAVGAQLIPAAYLAPFMLMMAAGSSIMMTLTHYATGTSPIVFGSGYVTLGNWWRVGFVMCVVELLIFAVLGGVWWKVLGYW